MSVTTRSVTTRSVTTRSVTTQIVTLLSNPTQYAVDQLFLVCEFNDRVDILTHHAKRKNLDCQWVRQFEAWALERIDRGQVLALEGTWTSTEYQKAWNILGIRRAHYGDTFDVLLSKNVQIQIDSQIPTTLMVLVSELAGLNYDFSPIEELEAELTNKKQQVYEAMVAEGKING